MLRIIQSGPGRPVSYGKVHWCPANWTVCRMIAKVPALMELQTPTKDPAIIRLLSEWLEKGIPNEPS